MENHGERERDGGIQVRERERGGSSREIERDVNVKVDDTIFFFLFWYRGQKRKWEKGIHRYLKSIRFHKKVRYSMCDSKFNSCF